MVAYVIFIKSGRTTKESSIFTRRWLPPLSRVIRSGSASRTDTRKSSRAFGGGDFLERMSDFLCKQLR
jgi:hypothetical protein